MNDSEQITPGALAMYPTAISVEPVRDRAADPLISVVLPVYNEVEVLDQLVASVSVALIDFACRFEMVFVNDGSTDGSAAALDALSAAHDSVRVVHFSRNFGHQAAVHAGLAHASGDAIVVMDSDLQDDPAAIPTFVEQWRHGYDVVYAVRANRKENWLKRTLFFAFYRVLNAIATTSIPMDAGNFSLIDRRVVNHVIDLPERDRFFPGLRHWVGFRQIGVRVERHARHDDRPRVSMVQLFSLAKTAIFGFSRAPLNCFYVFALISLTVFTGCSSFALYHKLVTHLAIPGWTSITMVSSLYGKLNSLGICVLGEYVIRIYDQVRARPGFVVDRRVNFDAQTASAQGDAPSFDDKGERELQQFVAKMSRDLGSLSIYGSDPLPTSLTSNLQP